MMTERLLLDRLVVEVRDGTVKAERLREAGDALTRAIEDHRVLTDRVSLQQRQIEGLENEMQEREAAYKAGLARSTIILQQNAAYIGLVGKLIEAGRELIHVLELPSQDRRRRDIPKRRSGLYDAIIEVEALETPF